MNVLIVDDEPLARDRLKRMVNETRDWNVIAEACNGVEAVAQCSESRPDVVLMDIRMPEMDGLSAARKISDDENAPAIIFCTAYDEYGVEAFEAEAVGYLLKPVRQENLESALLKAQRLNRLQLNAIHAANDSDCTLRQREHITSRSRRGIQMVPFGDVRVFKADHKYVTAYHHEGDLLIDDTLKELEAEFPDKLIRVHRNSLVAIGFILGMERNQEGVQCLVLEGIEERPQVSRRHLPRVRKLLQTL
ncbi:MAG: LytR/AlgR family response regulator transcription factor [Pseudomonadales bacterium]